VDGSQFGKGAAPGSKKSISVAFEYRNPDLFKLHEEMTWGEYLFIVPVKEEIPSGAC
jgi:hypothetical protein